MKTEKLIENPKTEPIVILKNVKQGSTIRFPHDTFEQAMEENLFYLVTTSKDKRVKLVCLANAEIIERDEEWRVIEHEAKLQIKPNN